MTISSHFQKIIAGLLMLSLPFFFENRFTQNYFTATIFILLVSIGMSICIYFGAKLFKLNGWYALLFFGIIELSIFGLGISIKNGWLNSPYLLSKYQSFYISFLRQLPTFQPDLGKYDDELFYTLHPGQQRNKNLEYNNLYQVNSYGLRDDEESIHFPKVVVLGDSHSMGLGVHQKEIYASIFEEKTQQKTLNTSIASYGTAREYLISQRIALDSCKVIIWQYSPNDAEENAFFLGNKNQLKISSEAIYNAACCKNFIRSHYYPFKFTFGILAYQINKLFKPSTSLIESIDYSTQCSNFFKIVQLIQSNFKGNIFVFAIENPPLSNPFYTHAEPYMEQNNLKRIQIVDFSNTFTENDFYQIDGHLNKHGHKKVANTFIQIWGNYKNESN